MNHHVQSNAAVENAFATIFSEYGEEQANEFRDQATLLIEPAPTGKSTADAGESAITLQRIPQSERPDLASPAGKSTRSAATRCTVYPSSLAAYQASLREHASAWIRPWWHYALALVWLGIFSYGVIGLWSSETAPQAPTASAPRYRCSPIEKIVLGQRVMGTNPIRGQAETVVPEQATWRKLKLSMTKANGLGLEIELLRPLAWVEENKAQPGNTVELELEEMGAAGPALVTALEQCPVIASGTGTIVTGLFRHEAGRGNNVVRLQLEGQQELTGVTDNHLYWSVDRQDFVPVGDLRVDERIDTIYGERRIVAVTPIEYRGILYNLETTEHVYQVGSLGTLVHNNYASSRERGMHATNKSGAGAARPERHHIFPQEEKKWFADRGFDIDKVTIELDRGTHSALHTMKWNEVMMKKLNDAEAIAGRKLNSREIWEIGDRVSREFKLRNLTYLPFKD